MTEPERRLRPGRAQDHRRPRRRRLGRSTDPRPSSPTATPPTSSSSPRAPTRTQGAKGITLFGGRDAACRGFTRGRKLDKVGQDESDTAELFFDGRPGAGANLIGEVDRGFIHMMERLPQERLGAAASQHRARRRDPRRDHRVREAAQGVRPADRLLPAQQVPDRRTGHAGRGVAGVRRRSASWRTTRRAHRGRRRQGQVVVRAGAERRARRAACSCTAATAS